MVNFVSAGLDSVVCPNTNLVVAGKVFIGVTNIYNQLTLNKAIM